MVVKTFQEEIKEKDQTIRKFEQEIDSLSFRNQQLSSRVLVLQQDLEISEVRGKKHKVILTQELQQQESSVRS